MRVGILETGAPPRDLQPRFGRYATMFKSLLSEGRYDWRVYDVRAGELPARAEDCAAYIVTGSAAGAYDLDPWIVRTQEFLQDAKGRAALVGVCFGHQLMAQAFGGRVIKSPKGWGIGMHHYQVFDRRPWMDEASVIASPASHQDQVVDAPPNTTVLAGCDFTPMGMLAYDDQPAISIQLHPEFEPTFAVALIEARRESRFGDDQATKAVESLSGRDDRLRLGRWIEAFLERHDGAP
ncbi:MAG TPA: type 1 glutamine amidotransferase [Caulobacteraceae bacterium]